MDVICLLKRGRPEEEEEEKEEDKKKKKISLYQREIGNEFLYQCLSRDMGIYLFICIPVYS